MLGFILFGGALFDFKTHRIPNWWILLGITAGILSNIVLSESPDILGFWIRMLVVIAVCFPLFLCRMIGAGDVKLMALICAYLKLPSGVTVLCYGLIIGAAVSLVKLLYQGSLNKRLSYFFAYIRQLIRTKAITVYHNPARDGYESTIPFALCLWAGFVIYLFRNHT